MIEPLDSAIIWATLSSISRHVLNHLIVLDCVDSTNRYVWTQQGTVACLAEYQWAGRGQQGRQWLSPYKSGLYLSIKQCCTPAFSLAGFNIAVAVTIAQTLQRLGVNGIRLKWPNDILWQGYKLGGVLIESRYRQDRLEVVVGIGINVKISQAQKIAQPWVDLFTIQKGVPLSRNLLAAKLIDHCLATLISYAQSGLTAFKTIWQRLDLLNGQLVTVLTDTQDEIRGIAQGIDAQGALCLETNQGYQYFTCGRVTVQWPH